MRARKTGFVNGGGQMIAKTLKRVKKEREHVFEKGGGEDQSWQHNQRANKNMFLGKVSIISIQPKGKLKKTEKS